jgi:hypothetical protein
MTWLSSLFNILTLSEFFYSILTKKASHNNAIHSFIHSFYLIYLIHLEIEVYNDFTTTKLYHRITEICYSQYSISAVISQTNIKLAGSVSQLNKKEFGSYPLYIHDINSLIFRQFINIIRFTFTGLMYQTLIQFL